MSSTCALLFTTFTLLTIPVWSVTLVENGQARCIIVVPREEGIFVDTAEDLGCHL